MRPQSVVSIVKTRQSPGDAEITEAVKEAIRLAGGLEDIVSAGSLVLVKPNLGAPPSLLPGKTFLHTSPAVAKAVADMVSASGGRPIIAESSGYGIDTERVIEEAGYATLRDQGYEVIDLKKTKVVTVPLPQGQVLDKAETYELVTQVQAIISVPLLKMHSMARASLSLKCMKGLQTDRYKVRMHRMGLIQGIADICSVFRPAFAVVDGIFAMEGLGKPVEMDVIIAGNDPVAVDTIASEIMGLDSQEIEVLKNATKLGIGTMDRQQIQLVGAPIESVKRRLLRPTEDNLVDVPAFTLWHADGTCSSCRNMVLSTIGFMKNTPLLDYFRGLTVITGDAEIPAGTPEESIVAIGNCVPKAKRGQRFVRGCPPHPWDIGAEIAGGMDKVAEVFSVAAYWMSKEAKEASES